METPSPFQARIIRLRAEGCRFTWYGAGQLGINPPDDLGDTDSFFEWRERIKDELNGSEKIPEPTVEAMLSKGLLVESVEERYNERLDRTWHKETMDITPEAELWLLDAHESDFISPEGETPEFDAEEILGLLHERHNGSGWAFFAEFTAGVGQYADSRFDAFAISLWPSRGFVRIVYEIKVYRSDFLKELKNPSKQARALKFANKFFYAAPEGLIDPDELPENCGLIEAVETSTRGRHMRVKRNAPVMDAPDFPMWFVAAIMRRVDWAEYDSQLRRKANAIAMAYGPLMSSLLEDRDGESIKRTLDYWFRRANERGNGITAELVRDYLERYNKVIQNQTENGEGDA